MLSWRCVLLFVLGLSSCYAGAEPLRLDSDVSAGLGTHFHGRLKLEGAITPWRLTRKFDSSDGFPEVVVNEFVQDTTGVIWMATEGGLYSFDGCRVRLYDTDDIRSGHSVELISNGTSEEIWFGAPNGVSVIDVQHRQRKVLRLPNEITSTCISTDHQGRPIVGSNAGLFLWEESDFQRVPDEGVSVEVSCCEPDPGRQLTWIGTEQGLVEFREGRISEVVRAGLADAKITALHLDRHGVLWVGTDRSLLRVTDELVEVVVAEDEERSCNVRCIVGSRHGVICAATDDAANILVSASSVRKDPLVSYRSHAPLVATLFIDRDGNRWSGLEGRQVKFIYAGFHQFSNRPIGCVLKQPESGVLWFATCNLERGNKILLARMKKSRISTWRLPSPANVLRWVENELLIATDDGLWRFDGNGVVPYSVKELQSVQIFDLALDESNVLWVATSKGVFRVRDNQILSHRLNSHGSPIRRIQTRGRQQVMATLHEILYFQDGQQIREFDFSNGNEKRQIRDLIQTKDGEIWFGSTHGLYRHTAPTSDPVLIGDGNRIVGTFLVEKEGGQIWAGSSVGLFRIDRSTEMMQLMLPEDGTGPGDIWHCCEDGRQTWLAGGSGLFRYRHRSKKPQLVVDRITTDRQIPLSDKIHMTTDEPLLALDFHAVSPGLRNGSTAYRYRMPGYQDDWKRTNVPRLEFQDLTTGSYQLELQAFDINLIASDVLRIPIEVGVPIARYATNGALAFMGLSLVAFVTSTIWRQRDRNEALSCQVTEAEREHVKLTTGLQQAQKLDALGTLAAGMAHDFNNSLQVIITSSDLALMSHDQSKTQDLVLRVRSAAEQAADLTESMLAFARREPDKIGPIRLDGLVSECVEMMRPTIPANVSILTEIDDVASWCLADEMQIRQAIINLMVNARDAMPDGGKLHVSLREEDALDVFVIGIQDSGSGIAASLVDRVFEPFFTTKSRGEGTGLGLYVTHGIVDSHHGTISVDSTLGVGSCFEITLPRCATPSLSLLKAGETTETDGAERVRSVLVADDHPVVRESLRQHFELHDCIVQEAENGVEALRLAVGNAFDAIVLDIDMPMLDGIEVAQRLRDSGDKTRLVVITGGGAKVELQSNMVLLRKPFVSSDLLRAAFPTEMECEAK